MAQHGGYEVDPVTRKDLDTALEKQCDNINEHIDLLMAPIVKEQTEVRVTLTGASRMNGLVGKVKTLITNLKVIYILLAFIAAGIFKEHFLDRFNKRNNN